MPDHDKAPRLLGQGPSLSPPDQLQAATWQHDTELLEHLRQLEYMVHAEQEGAELLQAVLASRLIAPNELGTSPS